MPFFRGCQRLSLRHSLIFTSRTYEIVFYLNFPLYKGSSKSFLLGKEYIMDAKKQFNKHYGKLLFEAVIKSVLMALVVGFAAAFVSAMALWIIDEGFWWLSFVAFGVGVAAALPLFFVFKFKPTAMSNARRIDRLGLDERLITMVEFENDDSYIAKAQREDAVARLNEFDPARIKLKIPAKILITLAIVGVFGSGMTTVSGLSAAGLIPGFNAVVDAITPDEPDVYVAVTYIVEEGGYIEGESDQLVLLGTNADPVEAIADDGYAFKGWTDGYKKPFRSDSKVTEEIVLYAVFEEIMDGDGEDADDGNPSDKQDPNGKPDPNAPPDPNNDKDPSNMGGGKHDDHNQIVDGETYYREAYEGYRDEFDSRMESSEGDLTGEEADIAESYMDVV